MRYSFIEIQASSLADTVLVDIVLAETVFNQHINNFKNLESFDRLDPSHDLAAAHLVKSCKA